MLPILSASLLTNLFGLGDLSQMGTLAIICGGLYWVITRFSQVSAESLPPLLSKLPARAANLLRHIDSLGLPMLATLLKDVAERNWTKIPADVDALLDALDDKQTRSGILETIFVSQLTRQIGDADRRANLLALLEKQLGVTITPPK